MARGQERRRGSAKKMTVLSDRRKGESSLPFGCPKFHFTS